MNPREYIQNPMGKGSAIIPNPEIKNKMRLEYEKVRNKITINRYVLDNRYLIYFLLIPSTSSTMIRYNVVLQFDLEENKISNYETIDFLNFLCYSNCPSFIFTYASVYNNQNMLIPWLKSKYSKEVFMDSKVRNAYKLIGYEKSLYLSFLYILSNRRNVINEFMQNSISVKSPNKIIREVLSSDEIMRLYNKSKTKEKEDKEKKNPHLIADIGEIKSIKRRERSIDSKIEKTKKINKIKKSKSVSHVKNVKKM